jgi:hypothetical protein
MSGVALVLAAASILFSAYLYTRIQNERSHALVVLCERNSAQSAAIIAFLAHLNTRRSTLRDARKYFPVFTHRQCSSRSIDLVGPPPVKR